MSKYYMVTIAIKRYNPSKAADIIDTINDEVMPVDDIEEYMRTNTMVVKCAGYLNSDETMERFTATVTDAVVQANEGVCPVKVKAKFVGYASKDT